MKIPLIIALSAGTLLAAGWLVTLQIEDGRPRKNAGASAEARPEGEAVRAGLAAGKTEQGGTSKPLGGEELARVRAVLASWRPDMSEEELKAFEEQLKEAGLSARLARNWTMAMRVEQREQGSGRSEDHGQKARHETGRNAPPLIARMMPERPGGRLASIPKNLDFGTLGEAQQKAVAKIEADYRAMIGKTYTPPADASPEALKALLENRKLLEQEKLADIAAVLTPEEYETYLLNNSTTARRVAGQLRGIEVNEEEFKSLYRLQASLEEQFPSATSTMKQNEARSNAFIDSLPQVREILGEERFYPYLQQASANYAQIANHLAELGNISPAVSYQVYQLSNELNREIVSRSTWVTDNMRRFSGRDRVDPTPYYQRLEALLGASLAAQYMSTKPGAVFGRPPGS